MNYRKLVVILCLGSHLLATSTIVNARHKRNPFKEFASSVRQLTKETSEIPEFARFEADATAALQEVKDLSGNYLKDAESSLNRTLEDLATSKKFIPASLTEAADELRRGQLNIPYLNNKGLDLTSTMLELRQVARKEFKTVVNLTEEELARERSQLSSVLTRLGHADLLDLSDIAAWTRKIEQRFSPKVDDQGTTVSQLIREIKGKVESEIATAESIIWKLAGIVGSHAVDLAQHYMTNIENLDPVKASTQRTMDFDETTVAPDEDDLFDNLCGYVPVPIRLGAATIFLPADRKVPAHCGGIAAKRSGQAFIYASEVPESLRQSEVIADTPKPDSDPTKLSDRLHDEPYKYKGPYGVFHDSRLLMKFNLAGWNVGITPHFRLPLAWSLPDPSPNTISTKNGNTLSQNAKDGKIFFSPEFEMAWFITPPSDGFLATAVANVEFPIVARVKAVGDNRTTGAVLQQIILRVGTDIGVRWDKADIQLTETALNALLRLITASEPILDAEDAAFAIQTIKELLAIAAVAGAAFTSVMDASTGFGESEKSMVIALTSSVPFIMAGMKMALEFIFGDEATLVKMVNNISLIKLQFNVGFLNAHYAAALAKKQLPLANVGFKRVNPKSVDWFSMSLAILPQVTQVLYEIVPGTVYLQLWGPYSVFTPQMIWPETVAGSYFINNGSDQYEPLGVQ